MLTIQFAAAPADASTPLIIPVRKTGLDEAFARAPGEVAAIAAGAADQTRFDGSAGSALEQFVSANGAPRRIIFIGIGSGEGADVEKGAGAAIGRLLASKATSAHADLTGLDEDAARRFALAALLRSWRIERYKTKIKDDAKPVLATLSISGAGSEAMVRDVAALAEGVAFTRELVSEPGNILYPESFVERCRGHAEAGIAVSVLDDAKMRDLGMGALIGVGQGSARPPRILALEWKGEGASSGPPLVLIGKGVTFDTGGISLKPGPGMEDMKWDMGGAGAVAGAMLALAKRNVAAHVVGVCVLAENMPDGNAQRPGDIVTTMSGQTVEVLNTDAEGRLILCDAMTWAQRTYSPDVVIDLATLTGAMIISLGREHGGIFANDDALASELLAAGATVGEKLWRFPLGEAYDKLIDSPIADIKNIGPREGGSITAAQFLQRFVEKGVHWAHLDIAGMVWSDKEGATHAKGATGYGVRLLNAFVDARLKG